MVTSSAYQPFVVQAGVPLEWILDVGSGELNGCNNPVTVPALGISLDLTEGENLIAFTPGKEGRIGYTCWMGMIDSSFYIVENLDTVSGELLAEAEQSVTNNEGSTGSCCSTTTGSVLAGPVIAELSPEDVVIADMKQDEDGTFRQHVVIIVDDNGFSPSVLILERNLPAVITFRSSGPLKEANYRVSFPEYGQGIELVESDESVVSLIPETDFRYVSWRETGSEYFVLLMS